MRRGHIERNILFLCEDNACLSQIAEATAKHLAPPKTRIFSVSGQRSKGLADVPMQDIDLVVSFGDAHKKCDNLPGRAKVENWPVPGEFKTDKSGAAELSTIRDERDEIDKRVFALFLDHWRNNA